MGSLMIFSIAAISPIISDSSKFPQSLKVLRSPARLRCSFLSLFLRLYNLSTGSFGGYS